MSAPEHRKGTYLYMKKTVTSIICALILTLALAACGAGNGGTADKENGENVQIPAPWTDYNSVEEAEAQAGFDITAPERIGNYEFDFARAERCAARAGMAAARRGQPEQEPPQIQRCPRYGRAE